MKEKTLQTYILFALPLLVIISSVFTAYYVPLGKALTIGITADLTLTLPVLYLAAIWKRKIPKTTVLPVLGVGILIGTFILPEDQQTTLNVFKYYALPVLELLVLAYLIYGVYTMRKHYQLVETSDFYTKLLSISQELFPKKLSYFMASELSIPYYCFFCWKKPNLSQSQFFYHQKSGSTALLWALIMIISIETIALHFVISLWSTGFAWFLTILSIYTCLQVLSLIKSMKQRPIEITSEELWLKYGTLCEAKIPLEVIHQVVDYDRELHSKELLRFSPLGELETPNLCLEFKYPIIVTTIFGKQHKCTNLMLFVDEKEAFKEELR